MYVRRMSTITRTHARTHHGSVTYEPAERPVPQDPVSFVTELNLVNLTEAAGSIFRVTLSGINFRPKLRDNCQSVCRLALKCPLERSIFA